MDLLEQAKAQKKQVTREAKTDGDKKPASMFTKETVEKKKPAKMDAPKKAESKPKTKTKKKVMSRKVSEVPPILILLWGYDGTSKSEQIMKFKPEPLIIDLENKLEPLAKKLGFPLDNIIVASKYNEKYEILGGDTLETIRDMLSKIRKKIQDGEQISAIGLDGISDLRPYAVEEWLEENPKRKQPTTAGDWRDINDKVRDICFQLINIGRVERISIFLTAQVGGEYKNNVRVKDIPDCKPWITYNIDHKFRLYVEDKEFLAYCEKSYLDPFWTVALTDFSHETKPSLMNILQDTKMLNKYKKEYEEQTKQTINERKSNALSMM